MIGPSPYELEIEEEPEALRRLAGSPLPSGLAEVRLADHPRIVLTGMGASHFAAIPLWRNFLRAGYPAWWVSTAQLMDSPELVTPESLVIMTSQSGRSGEVVAAVAGGAIPRARTVIGVTDDPASPLGEKSDHCLPLRSGAESTVSAKSYVNTLAAHSLLWALLTGGDRGSVIGEIIAAAADLDSFDCAAAIAPVARATMEEPVPRVALIGKADDAATALLGGLILKEAAKVAAEGYVGGEFRHGPLEIAGPGLTAVIFAGAGDAPTDPGLTGLARELADTGSRTLVVGGVDRVGTMHIGLPTASSLGTRILGAKVTQVLSVALARAGGRVPGEFLFGQKITSKL